MKKIICLCLLIISMAGCQTKLAYYQPGKTLKETKAAYAECSGSGDVLYHCMVNKGYDFHNICYEPNIEYTEIHSGFFKIGIAGE